MPSGLQVRRCVVLVFAAMFAAVYCQGQQDETARPGLKTRSQLPEAPSVKLAIVNGRPYTPPTLKEQLNDYWRDSYGLPALAGSTVRALYSQGRGKPQGWGTDFPGFMQREGSAYGITAINGNVRHGLAFLLKEDIRYIPCHGCRAGKKIENALLAEITARHAKDGHRVFTLTPTIADFSGPIIAHTIWYPGKTDGPEVGVVSARLVFAVRIGQHLFREFVLEKMHYDPKIEE